MSNSKTPELARELRNTVTRLIKRLRRQSSTGGEFSLTERSTLALLEQHGQLLPSELAAMEHITTQSMSQILNHLQGLNLIIRTPSATDGRKVIITLSTLGQEKINKVRNEREEWLNKAIYEVCTPEEQELLLKALGPLKKLIEYPS